MIINIYDFEGCEKACPLKSPVKYILITVLSGDEVATVYYEDGSIETFDWFHRDISYYDGHYIVKDIDKWNNFTFKKGSDYSYQRLSRFADYAI